MNHFRLNNDEDLTKTDWRVFVDCFYGLPEHEAARGILLEHSHAVADLARELNENLALGLDPNMVETAAMLHDIGIIATHAPGIGCYGHEPYIRHGIIGADMLRGKGAPEWAAKVAERHTGSGLTADEIHVGQLPLPTDRVLYPVTCLERLICYADKFFSKKPGLLTKRKNIDQVMAEIGSHGDESLARFIELHKQFT